MNHRGASWAWKRLYTLTLLGDKVDWDREGGNEWITNGFWLAQEIEKQVISVLLCSKRSGCWEKDSVFCKMSETVVKLEKQKHREWVVHSHRGHHVYCWLLLVRCYPVPHSSCENPDSIRHSQMSPRGKFDQRNKGTYDAQEFGVRWSYRLSSI